MSDQPLVTLVIVTYNSAPFVGKALESIQAQTFPQAQVRVVVVDNASRDDTVAVVQQQYPWATLLPETINHGFARGNNVALRRFPARYYALVNPDVELHPAWLSTMVEALEADPTLGVAGSKIFFGNRVLLQHTGGMIRANALTYHYGANEFDLGQYETPVPIDYAMGAALFARGDVTAQVGYLPEAYFMYFEEVEFCVRVARAGYAVRYLPQTVAYHDEKHSTSGTVSWRFLLRYHAARYLFAMRLYQTPAERAQFVQAERAWLAHMRDWRYRLLLWRSLWQNRTLWRANGWLWQAWWPPP